VAYKINVQRLDGRFVADERIFFGPPLPVGSELKHEGDGQTMRIRILHIRAAPGRGIGSPGLDEVDAVEIA
jgi:hypothetical protein